LAHTSLALLQEASLVCKIKDIARPSPEVEKGGANGNHLPLIRKTQNLPVLLLTFYWLIDGHTDT
jgi:hypothetical protein